MKSLLKQIALLDARLSFEDDGKYAKIRYTVPEADLRKFRPLHSYVVLESYGKKPRDRYEKLLGKICEETARDPFDSSESVCSSLDEYILKIAIGGGR